MEIQLLGTGAAEGIPAFLWSTEVDHHAVEFGGKDVRMRSAAILDNHIKIDLGPDTLAQMHKFKLNLRDWSGLVFTHSHDDHFSPAEIQYGLYPFNEEEFIGYPIYGNAHIVDTIAHMYPDWPLELCVTRSFESFMHAGYRITPIHANHMLEEDAHNLIFEKDGITFLYGTDTGLPLAETWEFLQSVRLDGLVIECTEGFVRSDYFGHLDIEDCKTVVERMRTEGILKPGATVTTTHHSHQGLATHAQLEAALNPFDIQVGYDGLKLLID